jgi:hypothetical protein
VRPVLRRLRHNSAVRAVALPLYRANARLHPGPPPRVLANSLPKSGTHLVTALLDRLPDMRYSGHHLTAYDVTRNGTTDWTALRRRLASVRTGQYVSAHLPAWPELFEMLGELGYRCLFAVRDPRDAAVSDMHYIMRFPQHPLHDRLRAMPSDDERLTAVITGMGGERAGLPLLESMPERLDAYLGWLGAPATRPVRFERLVGSRGGGDAGTQHREIAEIAQHVGRPLTPAQVAEVAAAVWSPGSSTFRRGAIGDWVEHFTDEHRALVARLAGRQLAALGYEVDPR